MNSHFNNTDTQAGGRRFSLAVKVVSLALLGLTGCAGKTLQHTFYDGVRSTAEQCQLTRKPTDPACVSLSDYRQYEKERAREKGMAGLESSPQGKMSPP